ncbi:MAG TPA: ferredoxin [archaeon]|nr:ferredoxin [archaeon]
MLGFGKKKGELAPPADAGQSGKGAAPVGAELPYRVTYDRQKCIGAAVCNAVAPKLWTMAADGKAVLVSGRETSPGQWERDIPAAELEDMKRAADGCPALVIHVFDKRTGEKII